MKTLVLSLGGSLIIPEDVDYKFLENFKKTIRRFYGEYRFAVVCGGGAIARKYITALKKEKKNEYFLSQAGIRATRMNALFMTQFFGEDANSSLPRDMKEVKSLLKKNKIVFCGALRWVPHSTSDSTAAKLSFFLRTNFINITNVSGLYTHNPLTNKNAKPIKSISWKDFEKKANEMHYKSGQHFVLDQKASTIIKEHKIKTYIIGENMKNLSNLLKNKAFKGTIIYG